MLHTINLFVVIVDQNGSISFKKVIQQVKNLC